MTPQTRFGLKLSGILALILASLVGACALTAGEVKGVDAVLNDTDHACAVEEMASSIIPPGTPPALVAGDITMGCELDTTYTPKLESWVASLEKAQGDAGTAPPAGVAYKPGPKALVKLRARAVALGLTGDGSVNLADAGGQ